jgi:hypothetical protein
VEEGAPERAERSNNAELHSARGNPVAGRVQKFYLGSSFVVLVHETHHLRVHGEHDLIP